MAANTQLGKELKKLRIELGINLADMARKIEVSSAFLSAIETGKKKAPNDFLAKLANKYAYIKDNFDTFEILLNQSRQSVVLPLSNPSFEDTSLATAFARRFNSLTASEKSTIHKLLNKGEIFDESKHPT